MSATSTDDRIDEHVRALVREGTPQHLDGFWEGLEDSLAGRGRVRPVADLTRRRAWVAPAAAAAAVAAVVTGALAVRGPVDPTAESAQVPAGPGPRGPATDEGEEPATVDDWDDLEPGVILSVNDEAPDSPFATPPVAPGDVTGTAFFVDGAGRHALVTSAETAAVDVDATSRRVVTRAAHVTLATLSPSGWVVTNRLSERVDGACAAPFVVVMPDVRVSRVEVADGDGTVDPGPDGPAVVRDTDGNGHQEVLFLVLSRCGTGDYHVRLVLLDGPDSYELAASLPDGTVIDDRLLSGFVATPTADEWPVGRLDDLVQAARGMVVGW